jgi:predicted phage-related endonuclease
MKAIPKHEHGSYDWKLSRWKDENQRCLFGASDAPALMGASPYKTRGDLFYDKTTLPEDQETFNDVFYRGNLLEPALVQHAINELKTELKTPDYVYRDGRWSISMDAVDNELKPEIGVECKTTTRYRVDSAEDLPMEWRWQGYAQMLVLDVPIFFSVLDANQRVRFVELERNNQALDLLRVEAERFGEAIDANDYSGEIDQMTADQIAKIVPVRDELIELGADALTWVATLDEARKMKKQGEQLEREAKDHLARMMQSATRGAVNGVPVVTWKQQNTAPSLDVSALKQDHAELVENYMKPRGSFRVMRIVNKAEK